MPALTDPYNLLEWLELLWLFLEFLVAFLLYILSDLWNPWF